MDISTQQRICALRMAGLSVAAISRETGISPRRVDYLCSKQGVSKQEISIAEIAKAVKNVRNCQDLQDQLQHEIRLIIRTELAQANQIIDYATLLLHDLKMAQNLSLEKQANILLKLTEITDKSTAILRRAANSNVVYPYE